MNRDGDTQTRKDAGAAAATATVSPSKEDRKAALPMPPPILEGREKAEATQFSSTMHSICEFIEDQHKACAAAAVATAGASEQFYDANSELCTAYECASLKWMEAHTAYERLFASSMPSTEAKRLQEYATQIVLSTLLHEDRGRHFFESALIALTSEKASNNERRTASASFLRGLVDAMLARTVDMLTRAVDHICGTVVAALIEDANAVFAAPPSACLTLWQDLLSRGDALLHLAQLCLHATIGSAAAASVVSAGTHASGGRTAMHAGVLRLLDALLTCCQCFGTADEEASDEEAAKTQEWRAASMTFARKLTAAEMLHGVAHQVHEPVAVLEEWDTATREPQTVLYDLLRHGMLYGPDDNKHATNNFMPTRRSVFLSTASLMTTVCASAECNARRSQSPLELYSCAVAFLGHAAEVAEAGVTEPMWRAVVMALERALQEGESALINPNGSATASPPPPPPQLPPSKLSSMMFLSPVQPRVNIKAAVSDTSAASTTMLEEANVDSECATPREAPILTPATVPPTASAGVMVVTHAATGTTTAATSTVGMKATHPRTNPMHGGNTAASAVVPSHLCRSVCNLEGSVHSADATVAGMTDADTISLYGEGITSEPRTRFAHLTSAAASEAATAAAAAASRHERARSVLFSPSVHINAAAVASSVAPKAATALTVRSTSPPSTCPSPTRHTLLRPGVAHTPFVATSGVVSLPSGRMVATSVVSVATGVNGFPTPLRLPPAVGFRFGGSGDGAPLSCGSGGDRPERCVSIRTTASTRAAAPLPTLRQSFPSHVQLTSEILTTLTRLTDARGSTTASMIALADAGVLTVLSQLLEYPGTTQLEVITATLENCFAFWEDVVAKTPAMLTPGHTAAASFKKAASMPPPLHALLHTFTTFLGWDGEGWEVVHDRFTQRALRLLIQVLEYVQQERTPAHAGATSSSARIIYASSNHGSASSSHVSSSALLVPVVDFLLRKGVIAHVWRCLSVDATQIPGITMATSASTTTSDTKSDSNAKKGGCGSSSSFDAFACMGYGCFLFGAPPPVTTTVLSEAQCTAMHLLCTVAKSLDWSATPSASFSPRMDEATVATTMKKRGIVPSVATYARFMEQSFTHLPACANCLRRCTCTRSQTRPIASAEQEALSKVLNMLHILFTAMEAVVRESPQNGSTPLESEHEHEQPQPEKLRLLWGQQIQDSQVLDVLAHIGTMAELADVPLPRHCLFTLRAFLENAYVVVPRLIVEDGVQSGTRKVFAAAQKNGVLPLSGRQRAQIGMAALQAVLTVPEPPQTSTASGTTWGSNRTARESLLAILLTRMQRRYAAQPTAGEYSTEALRLEVLALLTDVLAAVVDTLPSPSSDLATGASDVKDERDVGAFASYSARTAMELVRLAQRVVTAVMKCRVWSGTSQELRCLTWSNTAPAKESMRFMRRVTQLVNGSFYGLVRAAQTSMAHAHQTSSLGQLTASLLLAESTSVTFAFHVVSMNCPSALAEVLVSSRWQTPTAATESANNGSGSGSGSRSSGGSAASSASSHLSSSPYARASATQLPPRVTMASPAQRASGLPFMRPNLSHRETDKAAMVEFGHADCRETCEAVMVALVELLCAIRRVEVLVRCPRPLRLLEWRLLWFPTASMPRAGLTDPASVGVELSMSAIAAPPPVVIQGMSIEDVTAQAEARQVEVVVVQNETDDFAGVISSVVYTEAVAHARAAATTALSALERPADSTNGEAASASSRPPQQDAENPRNWRATERQWRRRATYFRNAQRDALGTLDLAMMDRYLDCQSCLRKVQRRGGSGEAAAAAEAAVVLVAERKRYLEEL